MEQNGFLLKWSPGSRATICFHSASHFVSESWIKSYCLSSLMIIRLTSFLNFDLDGTYTSILVIYVQTWSSINPMNTL